MILDKITKATRIRVEKAKLTHPLKELIDRIESCDYMEGKKSYTRRQPFAFETELRKNEDISYICEVKKASPSKGVIAEDFPYLDIAREYEEAGAQAISVLTEPEYFKGQDLYLAEISRAVSIPVLRKDFTIDQYQIYEAKAIGADAILLICSLLDMGTLKSFLELSDELGLSALVEAHNEWEIDSAIQAGARIIGVNNRNLHTFGVDINNSINLRNLVPKEVIYVAESGISSNHDVMALKAANVNAVLIGETLMISKDKKEQLMKLRGYTK